MAHGRSHCIFGWLRHLVAFSHHDLGERKVRSKPPDIAERFSHRDARPSSREKTDGCIRASPAIRHPERSFEAHSDRKNSAGLERTRAFCHRRRPKHELIACRTEEFPHSHGTIARTNASRRARTAV